MQASKLRKKESKRFVSELELDSELFVFFRVLFFFVIYASVFCVRESEVYFSGYLTVFLLCFKFLADTCWLLVRARLA